MTVCASRRHTRKPAVERHEIMELLGQLKLAGMRAAYDEVVAAGVRAQHPFQRIFGELLLAPLADHRARSIAYRMGVALPGDEEPCRVRLHGLAGQRGAGARTA